jgi:putative endonuclease
MSHYDTACHCEERSDEASEAPVFRLRPDRRTVRYTSVTNDLLRRVGEHRAKTFDGFTSRYNARLAYYGQFSEATAAIAREKQIKAESRARKIALIHAMNPAWEDLFEGPHPTALTGPRLLRRFAPRNDSTPIWRAMSFPRKTEARRCRCGRRPLCACGYALSNIDTRRFWPDDCTRNQISASCCPSPATC